MTVAAIVLTGLAALVAVGNLAGCAAATVRRRRGVDRGFSSVPLLSLALGIVAWLLAGDELGPWPFLPAIVDPGSWVVVLSLPLASRGNRNGR